MHLLLNYVHFQKVYEMRLSPIPSLLYVKKYFFCALTLFLKLISLDIDGREFWDLACFCYFYLEIPPVTI